MRDSLSVFRLTVSLVPALALMASSLSAQSYRDARCIQDYRDEWVCADQCGDQDGNGCFFAPVVARDPTLEGDVVGGLVVPFLEGEAGDAFYPEALMQCFFGNYRFDRFTTARRTNGRTTWNDGLAAVFTIPRVALGDYCRIYVWNASPGGWYWINDKRGAAVAALAETSKNSCWAVDWSVVIQGLTVIYQDPCGALVRHDSSGMAGIVPGYAAVERRTSSAVNQEGVELTEAPTEEE